MDAVTLADVASLLTDRVGRDIGRIEPLEGGAWSRAFAFVAGGRALVIRFSTVEEDFRKDERAARFASAALLVPAVHEIGPAFGGWYAITDRRDGRYLEDADERGMLALLPSLLDTLDAMRAADVSDTTGFGGWGLDGNAPHATWRQALLAIGHDDPARRTYGWSARLAEHPTARHAFDTAYEALERLSADLPDARHLVHSDLLNRNVLVSADRITAVLDWGSALYGDFVFDLAWFAFWRPWYEGWSAVDVRAAAARRYAAVGLEVPQLDVRIRACELYIALDGMSYQAWAGFHAPLDWTVARTRAVLGEAGPGVR